MNISNGDGGGVGGVCDGWMDDVSVSLKSQTFTDAALFIGAVSVFLVKQRAGRDFEPILEFVPN